MTATVLERALVSCCMLRDWWCRIQLGRDLRTIRDERLYPDKTFETYCQRRWEFSRGRAYHLIAAAETVDNLSTNAQETVDIKEGTIRPLVKFRPEEQREIWDEAEEAADGKVTARDVQAAVNRHPHRGSAQVMLYPHLAGALFRLRCSRAISGARQRTRT